MVESCIVPQIIGTAARLGVADQISDGPRSSEELAAAVGAQQPSVFRRFLRACVAIGLLTEQDRDRFGLTPLGECLRSDGRQSIRRFADSNTAPGVWLSIGKLDAAVLSGRSAAEPALGMSLWSYYEQHPEEGASFGAGLRESSPQSFDEILDLYDVSGFHRIVDVGGNLGDFLAAMLDRAPRAGGVLFDLPESVDRARRALRDCSARGRIDVVGGDFLDKVPIGGDLYTLKAVLCDWSDADAVRILKNCHRAARRDSRLLIVDRMLPPDDRTTPLYLGDMFSFALSGGGVRSRSALEALMTEAGYEPERVITKRSGFALLVARRP